MKRHGLAYISTCMLFAVLWKVTSKDFGSGDFFEMTLLTDQRFHYFARILTGIAAEDLMKSKDIYETFFTLPETRMALRSSENIKQLSAFMAVFTIAIELLIPLSFLFLRKGKLKYIPHAALISFIFVTYPAASVIGFAWLLILFALTQCDPNKDRKLMAFYCLLFVLTQAFRIRFGEIGDTLLG